MGAVVPLPAAPMPVVAPTPMLAETRLLAGRTPAVELRVERMPAEVLTPMLAAAQMPMPAAARLVEQTHARTQVLAVVLPPME